MVLVDGGNDDDSGEGAITPMSDATCSLDKIVEPPVTPAPAGGKLADTEVVTPEVVTPAVVTPSEGRWTTPCTPNPDTNSDRDTKPVADADPDSIIVPSPVASPAPTSISDLTPASTPAPSPASTPVPIPLFPVPSVKRAGAPGDTGEADGWSVGGDGGCG